LTLAIVALLNEFGTELGSTPVTTRPVPVETYCSKSGVKTQLHTLIQA